MSTTIDERVVEMRFDNKQFESGIKDTMSLLDKFKAKLKFTKAGDGLEDLNRAVKATDLTGLEKSVSKIESSFTSLGIVGITVLQNITNSAIAAGSQIVKSLTITPIMSGMQEYELKLNSIQTILANVKRHGSTIDDVSQSLDELNHYADKTIYNFGQMTTAIGMFTTAGVNLETSVASVKGISNLAAFVGAPAEDATRAMYQLSQALSLGEVRLTDWMSLEHTAGMAGVEFQDRLKDTARILGENVDAAIEKNGSFRESLKEGWLTTEVLTETLKQFAGEVDEIYLKQQGWNDEQIASIMELGKTATESATIVKSFTQLIGTLAEAAQSGWAESWEIIIGNLDEAKELWTAVNNVISGMIDAQSQQRNEMLQLWKDKGGREALINSFKNIWEGVLSVITPVKKAFEEVFPYISGEKLADATKGFEEFTAGLKLSAEAAYTIEVAFKAILTPIKIFVELVKIGVPLMLGLASMVWKFLDSVIAVPSKTKLANLSLRNFLGDARYTKLASATSILIEKISKLISGITGKAKEFVSSITDGDRGGKVIEIFEKLVEVLTPVADWLLDHIIDGFYNLVTMDYSKITQWAVDGFKSLNQSFEKFMSNVGFAISKVKEFLASMSDKSAGVNLTTMAKGVTKLDTSFINFFKSFGASSLLTGLNDQISKVTESVGGLFKTVIKLTSGLSAAKILTYAFGTAIVSTTFSVAKLINSTANLIDGFKGMTGGITNLTNAITERVKPDKFKNLAVAITILAGALIAMSFVDADKLAASTKALVGLMAAFGLLAAGMAAINKFLIGTPDLTKSFQAMSSGLIMISGAIGILSVALLALSMVDISKLGPGLAVLTAVLVEFTAAMAILAKLAPKMSANSIALIAFAGSMLILVDALFKLTGINVSGVESSMIALIGLVGLMTLLGSTASEVKIGSSLSLILMVESLLLLADALENLASRDMGKLVLGIMECSPLILAMGALMMTTQVAGEYAARAGIAILAMSAAMGLIAEAVEQIGGLDLAIIAKGITAVGLISVFFEGIIKSTKSAGKHAASAGAAIAAMSVAILLLVVAIRNLGEMDLDALAKGTIAVDSMLALFALIVSVSEDVKGSTPAILAIATAMGLLTACVVMLQFIPWEQLAAATGTLSAIMLSLGKTLELVGKMNTQHSFKKIVMIGLIIAELTGAIMLLSNVPWEKSVSAAGSLALVLSGIGIALKLTENTRIGWARVKTNIALIGAILAEAVVAVGVLSLFNAEDLVWKATSLGGVMLAVGGAVAIMGKFGTIKSADLIPTIATIGTVLAASVAAVGVLSLFDGEGLAIKALDLGIVMGEVGALVAGLAGITKIANAKDTAKMAATFAGLMAAITLVVAAIGAFNSFEATKNFMSSGLDTLKTFDQLWLVFTEFGALTAALGVIGKHTTNAAVMQGLKSFGQVAGAVTVAIAAVGGLVELFQAEEWVATGAWVFEQVGGAIGGFFGNIVGQFIGKSTSGLSEAAENISVFAEKIAPFMEQVKDFGPDSATGVQNLVSAVSQLASMPIGEEDVHIATFVTYLEDIVEPLQNFAAGMQGVSSESLTAAADVMKSITDLVDMVPATGSILEKITGVKDLGAFAQELTLFTPAFATYALTMSNLNVDQSAVDASIAVANSLAAFANAIPASGGRLQEWVGSKSLSAFGLELIYFGPRFAQYYQNVKDVDTSVVEASSAAAQSVAAFANNIPASGGWMQDLIGNKSLSLFGLELISFGPRFKQYYENVKDIKTDAIEASSAAAQSVAEFANTLGPKNGWLQVVFGQNDLEGFGNELRWFGSYFRAYYMTIKDVKPEVVTASASAAQSVAALANDLPKTGLLQDIFGGSDIAAFGDDLESFGNAFAKYYDSIGGIIISKVYQTNEAVRDIIDLSGELSDLKVSTLQSFGNSLKYIAEAGITSFTEAFDNSTQDMKDSVVKPVEESVDAVENTLVIKSGYSSEFYDIGKYTIQGLMNGASDMRSNLRKLYRNIANDDILGVTRNALDTHSPSVEFEKIGVYTIQGFVNGTKSQFPMLVETFNEVAETGLEAGHYLVKNIADGITDEMSAEEAAEKKAKNISEAFSSAMEEFDINMEIRDNQLELADRLFPVDDIESLQRRHSVMSRNLQDMTQQVRLSIAEFQVTRQEFGDTAEETNKAYNAMIEQLISYYDAADEVTDLEYEISMAALNMKDFAPAVELQETGEYFVKNIAFGITSDTSIEDAVEIKAQNIASIFSETLERMDLDLSIFDLEQSLWEKTNQGASDEEKLAKQIESAEKHREDAQERAVMANVEYQATLQTLGEDAIETKEALEALRQAENDLADAIQNVANLKADHTESTKTEAQALQDYNKALSENLEFLLATTDYTEEEIKDILAHQTGWDIFRDGTTDFTEIFDEYWAGYKKALEDTVVKTDDTRQEVLEKSDTATRDLMYQNLGDLSQISIMIQPQEIEQATQNITQGVTDAFTAAKPAMTQAVATTTSEATTEGVQQAVEEVNTAISSGAVPEIDMSGTITGVIDGWVNGVNEKIPELAKTGTDAAGGFLDSVKGFLGINSPSTQMIEIAGYVVDGFVLGITQNEYKIRDALSKMFLSISTISDGSMSDSLYGMSTGGMGGTSSQYSDAWYNAALAFLDSMVKSMRTAYDDNSEIFLDTLLSIFVNMFNDVRPLVYDTLFSYGLWVMNTIISGYWDKQDEFIDILNTSASDIVNVFEERKDDFYNAGLLIAAQIAAGILGNLKLIKDAADFTASFGNLSFRNALGIHSPSKVFKENGEFMMEGLAEGMTDGTELISAAMDALYDIISIPTDEVTPIQKAASKLFSEFRQSKEIPLTMHPVIDYDALKKDIENSYLDINVGIDLSESKKRADLITSRYDEYNRSLGIQAGNTYNFNQYNSSPKALSNVDIYRQTKNQFAMFRNKVGGSR